MSLNLVAFEAMLKQLYPTDKVAEIVYKKFPLLNLMQKSKISANDVTKVPLIYTGTNNRSADFTTMLANTASVASVAFLISTADNFNQATIDHKLILSSKTDKQSFARAVDQAVRGSMDVMMRDIATSFYGDGTGAIGVISVIDDSGKTITFTDRHPVRALEPGCRIQGDDAAALTSLRAVTLTVTKVDREAGVITYTGDGSAWQNGDSVCIAGDATAKLKGLASWLPSGTGRAAALAASFFGVVRSTDGVRLGGIAYDASSETIEDALISAEMRVVEEGGQVGICVMNPRQFTALKQALGSRYTMGNVPGRNATIGYSSLQLAGGGGMIDVIPDPMCPPGVAYMLDLETWKIAHLGSDIVNTWNEDGISSLRSTASNDVVIRSYSYIQPYCQAPGRNVVVFGLS
jgi:hypothetical protein